MAIRPEPAAPGAPTYDEYVATRWSSLYRTAYLLTGRHADAEDLAQTTLVKLYQSWSRASRAASLDAYARRVLTNTYISSRRPLRARQERLVEVPPESATPEAGPEERLALWPHVAALPPRQRAVVVLRYYEDLSEQQIADALGCSTGTVKSTASAALKALRAKVADAEGVLP
jgi:RNA polymerase sigma-70 factor (sigma-E family)